MIYLSYEKDENAIMKEYTIVELYRMVELMADQLTTEIHGRDWVIEYYRKKVNENESRFN